MIQIICSLIIVVIVISMFFLVFLFLVRLLPSFIGSMNYCSSFFIGSIMICILDNFFNFLLINNTITLTLKIVVVPLMHMMINMIIGVQHIENTILL